MFYLFTPYSLEVGTFVDPVSTSAILQLNELRRHFIQAWFYRMDVVHAEPLS